MSEDGRVVKTEVTDLVHELPAMMAAISGAGVEVADLTLRGSTLHDAFIALTGRELRE